MKVLKLILLVLSSLTIVTYIFGLLYFDVYPKLIIGGVLMSIFTLILMIIFLSRINDRILDEVFKEKHKIIIDDEDLPF